MFRIAGHLVNVRRIINYRHQIKVPILYASSKYPPSEYKPQEKEPCPLPQPPPPHKPKDDSVFWGGMAVMFLAAGFAVYAKRSPEVRDWLIIHTPWFDDVIAVVYQENMSYSQFARKSLEDLKTFIYCTIKDDKHETCSMDSPNIALSEDSVTKTECEDASITCGAEPPPVAIDICAVVECVRDRADSALSDYATAMTACSMYNKVVEEIMQDFSLSSVKTLRDHMTERKKLVNRSVKSAEEAALDLNELISYLECGVQAAKEDIDDVRLMINNYQQKIKTSLIKYQWENDKSMMMDQLWNKVQQGMEKYIQETETIFPEVKYSQNKLQLNEDVDLLVYHTYRRSRKLKEELDEAIAGITERINRSLEILPQGEKKKQRDALIQFSVQQRRVDLDKEFKKRYDDLKKKNDRILADSLNNQLERLQETFQSKVEEKEQEANEKLNKIVAEKIAFEKNMMKQQLEEMVAKVKLVEEKLYGNLKAGREAKRSQELWTAASGLLAATKRGDNYVIVDKELRAIEKLAVDGDELVSSVLNAIPSSVREKGVVPESVLKKRYQRMEKTALRVALVENGGGPLPVYFLSWLQSALLFMKVSGIPQEELDRPGVGPVKDLDTFDLLQRARFWMERGNLAAALRYVSSLEGAARAAAESWLEAARAHLYTRQAADALLAHAASMALLYL